VEAGTCQQAKEPSKGAGTVKVPARETGGQSSAEAYRGLSADMGGLMEGT
jgi:hypothetical protein